MAVRPRCSRVDRPRRAGINGKRADRNGACQAGSRRLPAVGAVGALEHAGGRRGEERRRRRRIGGERDHASRRAGQAGVDCLPARAGVRALEQAVLEGPCIERRRGCGIEGESKDQSEVGYAGTDRLPGAAGVRALEDASRPTRPCVERAGRAWDRRRARPRRVRRAGPH